MKEANQEVIKRLDNNAFFFALCKQLRQNSTLEAFIQINDSASISEKKPNQTCPAQARRAPNSSHTFPSGPRSYAVNGVVFFAQTFQDFSQSLFHFLSTILPHSSGSCQWPGVRSTSRDPLARQCSFISRVRNDLPPFILLKMDRA